MDISEIFGDENIADIETETVEFTALPEGWYKVEVAEIKDGTSQKGNAIIKAKFQILDENYSNRKLFVNYNIQNDNPKVVQIAKKEIAALCKACEKTDAQSTDELIGSVIEVKVVIRKTDATQNDVKAYRQCGQTETATPAKSAPKAAAPKAAAPKAAASKGDKMPWEK